ncbi:MAG: hypothetical protein ACYS0C_05565 [Planctomycetota bacterium]|jgi:hypothetical protein
MNSQKIKPSRWWYGLSAGIVLFMFVCFGVVFITLAFRVKRRIHRIVVPAINKLEFPVVGNYIVFHEYQSVLEDKIFSRDKKVPMDLTFSLHSVDGSEEISLSRTHQNAKYQYGERKAVSFLRFEINSPGTYVLTATYADAKKTPRIVLGIGRPLIEEILVPGLFLSLFSTGSILLSAAIFWITFFRRRKAKKELIK